MATTSTIVYCENQDVIDAYPRIDKFDLKRKITTKGILSGGNYYFHNVGNVARLFKNGEDLGAMEEDLLQVNRPDEWIYNSVSDVLIINGAGFYGGTDPNLDIIEVGDIWDDVMESFRKKASRLIESELDKSISREILKDREGKYPTSIVRITALKTAILLIRAHDPTHADLIPLKGEYDEIIGKIQSGKIVMTGHRSDNDSKGKLRYINYPDNYPYQQYHNVYPVELRGSYDGNDYELLHLNFIGYVGTPPPDINAITEEILYWVKGKSSTKLNDKLLIDKTTVNFDYQDLGVGNMQVRFSHAQIPRITGNFHAAIGDLIEYGSDEELTIPIVYEIELWGSNIQSTVSQIKPKSLSRNKVWQRLQQ